MVKTGLEQLAAAPPSKLKNKRVGLLCNASSLDGNLVHAKQRLYDLFGKKLRALFSPQHGFFAEKQDNMIESPDRRDPQLDIPIFSLYSRTRVPDKSMMETIDTLIIDLQDVGTRVYTFMYTVSYCMEAARRHGISVVVLDRPNPVGGMRIEGNVLDPAFSSFVGRFPIPMRHGLTMGELAMLFNKAFGINCDLQVIPMQGWRRGMLFGDTGLPWVAPSPNLPTAVSAMVYPGQVVWEGTNISEGRGTTQPFELFGAPFLSRQKIIDFIGTDKPDGAYLRPVEFEPTSNKWQGSVCRGFQLHVTDPNRFTPYRTALHLLQAILHCHKNDFCWKEPPYEYEFDRAPIDLILGDGSLTRRLSSSEPIESIEASWQEALAAYDLLRRKFYLYTD